ncbi:hypothetical protein HPO96_32395 [Kribbella sandramycini]|uniref:Uncharacterized protein n=1 Tax=Kribbella sandramycini TaxID=60450 RepID=A0A7Y4P4B7_9ACTN|nr:hypothetical protein [Kribbella sandramycini]MBB6565956.1 hypothetical protein [Kribbella sandramycini]NOL44960.1 hypothetical protein [Kribbella sandramycini]
MDEPGLQSKALPNRSEPITRSAGGPSPDAAMSSAHQQVARVGEAAGNEALASHFQGVAEQYKPVTVQWNLPPAKDIEIVPGVKFKPKLTYKGDVSAKSGSGDTTATGTGTGFKFEKDKLNLSLAKGELEHKLSEDLKVKGSLDANPAGVTPTAEISYSFWEDYSLRLEFAPWKFSYDMKTNSPSVSSPAITGVLSRKFELATDHFAMKGTAEFSGEISIDPRTAVTYLAKRYAATLKAEAIAVAGAQAALVVSLVGGATLIGLDIADEDRRAALATDTLGRARNIVAAESVYLAELEGRQTTPHTAADKLAQSEARTTRAELAANLAIQEPLLTTLIAIHPTALLPFRWRDAALDDLERAIHTQLHAYAQAHPYRTLWGLRTREDEHQVTRIINSVRDATDQPQLLPA